MAGPGSTQETPAPSAFRHLKVWIRLSNAARETDKEHARGMSRRWVRPERLSCSMPREATYQYPSIVLKAASWVTTQHKRARAHYSSGDQRSLAGAPTLQLGRSLGKHQPSWPRVVKVVQQATRVEAMPSRYPRIPTRHVIIEGLRERAKSLRKLDRAHTGDMHTPHETLKKKSGMSTWRTRLRSLGFPHDAYVRS